MPVTKKINQIMGEVKSIIKDGKIAFGNTNYKYMSDEEVTSVIREKMVEKGLIMFPVASEQEIIVSEKAKDNRKDINYLTKVKQKFRIVDTEDETFIELEASGQGYDSADKGAGKAQTNSRKYCVIQTFMLTGDDPDHTSSQELTSRNTPEDVKSIVITGGKYKNKTWGEVLQQDKGYVEWTAKEGKGKSQEIAKKVLEG